MKIGKWIGIVFLVLIAAYLGVATWLFMGRTEEPFADYPITEAQWRGLQEMGGTSFTQDVGFETLDFTARDGTRLAARAYGAETADTVIVYLHGVNSNAALLNRSAGLLADASGARVITPDTRGHGASDGDPYTVDHIGQYEEDLADIVGTLRADRPDASVIVAGHSMGGGIALRYALLDDAPAVDGYLLFSPNFGDGPTQHDAPETAGTNEDPARGIVYFDTKGFIGILMYNILGITLANDTPVLFFNAPGETIAYSHAAVLSAQPTAPNDATKALPAIDAPLLVLIGSHDEVFKASAYPAFVEEYSDGEVIVVPGHSHNSLMNDAGVMERAAEWLAGL